MPAYTPTTWVDGTTLVNAANLNHIEQGLDDVEARLAVEEALVDIPLPLVNGKWLSVAGGALVWADAPVGGAGGGLDWEGAYAAGTPYIKGDVVTYNGVVYGAVNDSTGQTPPAANPVASVPVPLVTALPTTALFDGQECILTDSLTAPSYSWRLRYVAAKASNKWVFVGGSPATRGPSGTVSPNNTTAAADLSGGPVFTIPLAGLYLCEHGGFVQQVTAGAMDGILELFASDAGASISAAISTSSGQYDAANIIGVAQIAFAAGAGLKCRGRNGAATGQRTYSSAWMNITPVAVGG